MSDLPCSTHCAEDDQMRTRASSNKFTTTFRLMSRIGLLLPVRSPSSWDRGEQVGSLPCVLRFCQREASESRQVA